MFYELIIQMKQFQVDASLATSLMVVGAWIGCLLGSAPSEVQYDFYNMIFIWCQITVFQKYGRRATILLNNITFIVGGILCALPNKYLLFTGRFLAGEGPVAKYR